MSANNDEQKRESLYTFHHVSMQVLEFPDNLGLRLG
jgi:hypothetical protein